MKSYTNIEQSKVLSEILPLESADMHYNNGSCRGVDYTEHFSAELMPYQEALHLMKIHKTNFMFQVIPCWSLASLLGVIPYNITFNKDVYRFKLVKFSGHWECYHENFGSISTEIFKADNPIDACYNIILKLHELNLL